MPDTYTISYVIIILYVIVYLIPKIAGIIYINKHKKDIYNHMEAESYKLEGEWLIKEKSNFYSSLNTLGLYKEHNCSNAIVANAQNNPTKYVLKYSNIQKDKNSLEMIDYCRNYLEKYTNFWDSNTMVGKEIKRNIPFWVSIYSRKNKIALSVCDLKKKKIIIKQQPSFTFFYRSAAGKSTNSFSVPITSKLLYDLSCEISGSLTKAKHTKTQRSKMTNDLREAIKQRDNYTCQMCGNSVLKEPNLLLEVDHIIPISKGGVTEPGNLQTLCWRCNRDKRDDL